MAPSLSTNQSVSYCIPKKKGQSCGQAIRLVVSLILGINSNFSVTLGQFLSISQLSSYKAGIQSTSTFVTSPRSIFSVNIGQQMSSIIHRHGPDGTSTPF